MAESESTSIPSPLDSHKPGDRVLEYKATGVKLLNGWFIQHSKKLLKLSVPICLTTLFKMSLSWTSLLFLGHLPNARDQDSYLYEAAGLAGAFINVTGRAIGSGIATSSDTLSSQAYGYKNYKKVGVILQRGILVLGLVMFPIWAVWLNTESLLLIVKQPPCVARFSGFYANFFILTLPFTFLYLLFQRYLQAQSLVWQFVLIGFISNVINAILHAITIYGIELRFTGAIMSLVISNMLPALLIISYVWCRKLHKQTWGGWSFECLEEWGLYLKLAAAGTLMVTLDWWSIEITNFLAGALGSVELSVNIVWFQLFEMTYMPCVGIHAATSIRVGNELGAGNPQEAKRASFAGIFIVLIYSTIASIFLLSTKEVISQLFLPGDEEVAHEVSKFMYIAAVYVICDQLQSVLGGVLRGTGRQYIGAIVSFFAYYIIGLPIGVLLGFKTGLGIHGVWIGMTAGTIAHLVAFGIVLLLTNWEKESEKAIKRSQDSNTQKSEEGGSENVEALEMTRIERTEDLSDTDSLNSGGSDGEDTKNLLPEVKLKEVAKFHVRERTPNKTLSYKMRKLLLHGSFYVVGVCILIAGGVSSRFHPHVDPEEYYNCTSSNSSYLS